MGLSLEIERKFLVQSDAFIAQASTRVEMRQGYLNTDPYRVVRVRLSRDLDSDQRQAYLTIKGKSLDNGLSRVEWEQSVDYHEGEQLLGLCLPYPIEKTRYLVPFEGWIFEVDVFHGQNQGLIVAEVELPERTTQFQRPDWLGDEVTSEGKYTNASLVEKPFSTWVE